MYLVTGGRGLAGCGHLLVGLLGVLPLLLLLAGSGTRALVCLPCDESKCEEPRNCPGSIVQGVCGCCYMCARQRNESCGGAYGLHGACDRGLRCVIRPPLNGDSITEYEVGVCEGTASRGGPLPTWPAPSSSVEQSLAETFRRREDSAGKGEAPDPGREPPASLLSRSLPPPTPGPPRARLDFVGGGRQVGGSPRPHTDSHACGRSALGWVGWPGPTPRGGGAAVPCEPPGESDPRRPAHTGAVWDRVPHTDREILRRRRRVSSSLPVPLLLFFPRFLPSPPSSSAYKSVAAPAYVSPGEVTDGGYSFISLLKTVKGFLS